MSALLLALALLPVGTPSPAPKATPLPPPVLEGVVRGPSGAPVKDALVTVTPILHERWGGPGERKLEAHTDAEGRFRVPLTRHEPVEVNVVAEKLAPRRLDRVVPGRRLEVKLDKGRSLEGTVRDSNTGRPVAGAEVKVGGRTATTDAKGRFRATGLGSGPLAVSARAPGYDPALRPVESGARLELLLHPGIAIRGFVLGPDGKGVADARVTAESELPKFPVTATSLADGAFALAGVKPGPYRVFAHAKKLGVSHVDAVTVEAGSDARVDLPLGPPFDVVGRVLGPDKKPLAAKVVATELDGEAFGQLPGLLNAETGADGRFRVSALPPGSHALRVTSPGFASKRVEAEISGDEPAATLDLGDLELERGLTIRGRVQDEAKRPIAEAMVTGLLTGGRFSDPPPGARSESDGSFVLAGLSEGRCILEITAAGYGGVQVDAEAGADNLVATLHQAGAIVGQAVDENGRPVESFRAMARSQAPTRVHHSSGSPGVESPDGRFRLDDIAEGTYSVLVYAPERQPGSVKDVVVKAGGVTDVGQVRLLAGGTVVGTVVDGRGAPIAGASVTATGPGHSLGSRGLGTSDLAGAFEIHGVALGTVSVSASHPDFASARVDNVQVDSSQGPARVRVVMLGGGRIEGSARRKDGSGVPGAFVNAVPVESGWRYPPDSGASVDANGFYALDHVPPGRVAVRLATRIGQEDSFTALAKDVVVDDGETTVVDFTLRDVLVSGRVTRGGEPLAGVQIVVQGGGGFGGGVAADPAGQPQRGIAVTAPDGSYALIVGVPGKTGFSVESLDWSQNFTSRSVDVPDADTFALDFDLGGAPVSGIVVDKATGEPVTSASVQASPRAGSPGQVGAGGDTRPDGRFSFELQPGDYSLKVYSHDHANQTREVSVPTEGLSGLRFELSRGKRISGKVVDSAGRGIGNIGVASISGDPATPGASRISAWALPDGSFTLEGLLDQPYDVCAGDGLAGFGALAHVQPGTDDAVLTLRPAGRLRLTVRGADGLPVAAALARVDHAFGAVLARGPQLPTSPAGSLEMAVPQGPIELHVTKDTASARASADVPAGGLVSLDVQLAPGGTQ